MITLTATLVTAAVALRAELEPLTDHKLIQACAALPSRPWLATPDAAMSHVLCGACPIPAGSGKTNARHRLNRGGNRQANVALYRAVIMQLRWHQPTIDYPTRRTAEGLPKREIVRCLKRYLARDIYRLLPTVDLASSSHPAPTATAARAA